MAHSDEAKFVADMVDRHQKQLSDEIGKYMAFSVGVRTILESLAIEALRAGDERPTPVVHPRSAIEVDVRSKREDR